KGTKAQDCRPIANCGLQIANWFRALPNFPILLIVVISHFMLAPKFALRYIFSKKSTNAINVISWVSMLGMGVGAFALIVVLSVFNGFEGLVLSLYNSFYPDLEIRATQGKTFEDNAALSGKILQLDGI